MLDTERQNIKNKLKPILDKIHHFFEPISINGGVCVCLSLSFALSLFLKIIDVCKYLPAPHSALHIAVALADGSRCATVCVPDAYWCEKATFYKIQMKNMCFIPAKQLFVKQNFLMFPLCFFDSFVVIIALQSGRLFYICYPSQCEKSVGLHIAEIARIYDPYRILDGTCNFPIRNFLADVLLLLLLFFFLWFFFLSINRPHTIWVAKIMRKTSATRLFFHTNRNAFLFIFILSYAHTYSVSRICHG